MLKFLPKWGNFAKYDHTESKTNPFLRRSQFASWKLSVKFFQAFCITNFGSRQMVLWRQVDWQHFYPKDPNILSILSKCDTSLQCRNYATYIILMCFTLHYLHYCYVLEHTNMLMLYNPMLLTNNMVYLGQCPCYKILIEHLHNIVLLLWFTRVHIYFGVYKPWCSWIKYHSTSVTRWLYYFFKIWPFTTMKNCLKYKIFAKIGSQFCKIQNSNSRNGQKR